MFKLVHKAGRPIGAAKLTVEVVMTIRKEMGSLDRVEIYEHPLGHAWCLKRGNNVTEQGFVARAGKLKAKVLHAFRALDWKGGKPVMRTGLFISRSVVLVIDGKKAEMIDGGIDDSLLMDVGSVRFDVHALNGYLPTCSSVPLNVILLNDSTQTGRMSSTQSNESNAPENEGAGSIAEGPEDGDDEEDEGDAGQSGIPVHAGGASNPANNA